MAFRRDRSVVQRASRAGEKRGVIGRLSAGWQTTIADLALILFMVTAAAIDGHDDPTDSAPSPAASGEPLAVYRAGEHAPPLREWLAEQAPDERQYLTIVAGYTEGDAAGAAGRALVLAAQAQAVGAAARIVLEPGDGDELVATLAFDRPGTAVARSLP
jgi:hypothetical protein